MKPKVNALMLLKFPCMFPLFIAMQLSYYGVKSTEEDPYTIKEHLLVISNEPSQDYNSVHHVQELINKYLTQDLIYIMIKMHE